MSNAQRLRPAPIAMLAVAALLAACQAASLPSPSPTAKPTPIPTPGPPLGADVIASFLKIVGDPKLPMHVVLDGSVDVAAGSTAQRLTIGFDVDISGRDAHGKANVDVGPGAVSFEMLLVQDLAYLNNHGTWTEIPGYRQGTPLNPFANLTGQDDLTYRGYEYRSEGRVHHLVSRVWLGGDVAAMADQGWSDPVIDYNVTDIYVFDDGTPLQMHVDAGVSGTYSGLAATGKFVMSYGFTKVGVPVTIPAPQAPAPT